MNTGLQGEGHALSSPGTTGENDESVSVSALELGRLLVHAPYPTALSAGCTLRDRWSDLSLQRNSDVVTYLRGIDVYELEEWRADWVGDLLSEGGWR